MSCWRVAVRRRNVTGQNKTIRQYTKHMTTTTPNRVVQSYLFFDGRCEEALQFYGQALGAKVDRMMRFKENPDPNPQMCAPGSGEKIMHASFRVGDTTVMASDGRCEGKPKFEGFALSLTVPTEGEADKFFGELAKGGQVIMPLAKTFFSPRFGMVTDQFGVTWMVMVAPKQ